MHEGEALGGYTEVSPSGVLADRVDAFWRFVAPTSQGASEPPRVHRVLPDGCTDLIVHFRDASAVGRGAEPRLTVVGPMERFALVDLEPGSVNLGIRLRPGWALALLGVSPRELRNLNVPVEECAPVFRALQQRLSSCRSLTHAMALLREELSIRNASPRYIPRARTTHALQCIQSSAGQVRMSSLARTLGISERTLHRDILEEAGVAPKLLARVLRFQRALARLRTGEQDLSTLALDCGYADQSHFTREVRELAGVSPTGLLE
ncbi:helix-turn-helix transcriptional regulator [Myxococcus llanfairpwllgwyngyllgogerychwyrndrobwllllantysiliogogogochensis]|uniref:Helix-turn-helix transcriptional regulator n=1 Tax=Myxococcus llanfairpwllgwyngyllgogerychwyrndrobwllllantysiliogogogochensis TaxID=2590453 RepID=A0A540WVY7_9BACT|nr:helix-turn-helix transcriptional regulator [Myxococcus llanfairpwllgwyngyllgogerychwyrndrobwllllantysiliogogogochensis]TQF13182.1 helix-turn-helix transcriptional regulator [Myxococcus llanfairpwllgwyngyllgogerychwyrndrobwllllantysiliogogogochensis]